MRTETYRIAGFEGHWSIEHAGDRTGDYATKEAAFEAAVAVAWNSIKTGSEVRVLVPGRVSGNHSLGGEGS